MTTRTLLVVGGLVALVAALAVARARLRQDVAQGEPSAPVSAGRPVMLEFGKGICQACKDMEPVLEELRARHADRVEIRYVDLKIERNTAVAETHGVRIIPTQVFLDADGAEVWRHEGFLALDDIEFEMRTWGWIE